MVFAKIQLKIFCIQNEKAAVPNAVPSRNATVYGKLLVIAHCICTDVIVFFKKCDIIIKIIKLPKKIQLFSKPAQPFFLKCVYKTSA